MDKRYSVDSWNPTVARLIAEAYPRVHPLIARKWIEDESSGNPCAVGEPGVVDPVNKQPREIGLGQLYNPDDFKKLKIDPAAFRAYCVPGTQQTLRELTLDEMEAQVRYMVLEPISWGMEKADAAVKTYGLAWQGVAYWCLVKAPHALPGIIDSGLPAVTKKLGRAPRTWLEFRQELGMDDPAVREKVRQNAIRKKNGQPQVPLTEHERTAWRWMRALDACEKIGSAVASDPSGVA